MSLYSLREGYTVNLYINPVYCIHIKPPMRQQNWITKNYKIIIIIDIQIYWQAS
jgi:hypothetical protein